jgi:hypothetical protein
MLSPKRQTIDASSRRSLRHSIRFHVEVRGALGRGRSPTSLCTRDPTLQTVDEASNQSHGHSGAISAGSVAERDDRMNRQRVWQP